MDSSRNNSVAGIRTLIGTATLAMVDDSTIEIAPAMPAMVTSHLLVGDAAAVDTEQ